MKKKVLFLASRFNVEQIEAAYDDLSYDVIIHGRSDVEKAGGVLPYIEKIVSDFGDVSGVVGTSFYFVVIASLIAERLSLLSPDSRLLFLLQHKYFSRELQQDYVPSAVPHYSYIPLEAVAGYDFDYPVIIKPVLGSSSSMTHVLNSGADMSRIDFSGYKKLVSVHAEILRDELVMIDDIHEYMDGFVAEEIVHGRQITLDGFVQNGNVSFFGMTESIFISDTLSFDRFEYPVSFGAELDEKILSIARSFLQGISFDNSMFNIEMKIDERLGTVYIIEINPRMSSQFSYLFEKVLGVNAIEIAGKLSVGEKVSISGSGEYAYCFSCVLREKKDHFVRKLPSDLFLRDLEKAYPGVRIRMLVEEGARFSDYIQNTDTFRYAFVDIAGDSSDQILDTLLEVKRALHREIIFEPVG